MIYTKCITCHKEFGYYKSNKSGKYCSKQCAFISPEWKYNQSKSKKGKKASDETRLKMSIAGKGRPKSQAFRDKMTGKKRTLESLDKARAARKVFFDKIGRVSPEIKLIRGSREYKKWRKCVLKRDGEKCIFCGSTRELHVDHIIPFASLLAESKILKQEFYHDVENGRTLCAICHRKTESYNKKLYEQTEYKLLNNLEKLWKQKNDGSDFESFYKKQMEVLIDAVKLKLE